MNTISICLLWCLLWTGTVSTPSQVPLDPEDGVYTTGEWKYQCLVLGAGTPEQKVTGKLSFKAKEVVGTPFARLRTQMGEFQWCGRECGTVLGWYRINPEKKYAKWIRVRIDESKEGPVWRTIKE